MAAQTQAQCLLAPEQLDAIETAARASILAAFTSAQGYSGDADYSPRAWLINNEPDSDPDGEFDYRSVRLETTFQGAGVLNGDLTPECAAAVTAVLDALSAPAGAEDTRTREQRYHDALYGHHMDSPCLVAPVNL